jgi:hypothetical protein
VLAAGRGRGLAAVRLTPADVVRLAEVAGFEVVLRDDGSPALRGPPGVVPNAALKAALAEHRAGIVAMLGRPPEPEACPGYLYRRKGKTGWTELQVDCGSLVFEAEDTDFFCAARAWCPFRLALRR